MKEKRGRREKRLSIWEQDSRCCSRKVRVKEYPCPSSASFSRLPAIDESEGSREADKNVAKVVQADRQAERANVTFRLSLPTHDACTHVLHVLSFLTSQPEATLCLSVADIKLRRKANKIVVTTMSSLSLPLFEQEFDHKALP